jgi:hypothetical protein
LVILFHPISAAAPLSSSPLSFLLSPVAELAYHHAMQVRGVRVLLMTQHRTEQLLYWLQPQGGVLAPTRAFYMFDVPKILTRVK